MIRDFLSHSSMFDNRRRPANGRPRGGSVTNNKKTLPAVPRRGPEAGFHRIHYDFHGSGVDHIDSCLYLQSRIIKKMTKNSRTS